MRFQFDDARRPARMAKHLRTTFADHGKTLGLSGARDVCARLYGYPTYHELTRSCGTAPASMWDEACRDDLASERRSCQVESLVKDGLPRHAAETFVDAHRPTGRSPGRGNHGGKGSDGLGEGGVVPPVSTPGTPVRRSEPERIFDGPEALIRHVLGYEPTRVDVVPRADSYHVSVSGRETTRSVHEGDIGEYMALLSWLKEHARVQQDGSVKLKLPDFFSEIRVTYTSGVDGESVTLVMQGVEHAQPRLDDLGIVKLESWRRGIMQKNGLCLIVGRTGSGKTTTLNASVRELDRFSKKIYSVENPVEYRIPYVGQVALGPAYDFGQVVRNFMRSDPDVMILGEIHDDKSARNAFNAADRGHLVICTVRSESVSDTIKALSRFGLTRVDLRHVLRAILIQGRSDGTTNPRCVTFASPGDVDRAVEIAIGDLSSDDTGS